MSVHLKMCVHVYLYRALCVYVYKESMLHIILIPKKNNKCDYCTFLHHMKYDLNFYFIIFTLLFLFLPSFSVHSRHSICLLYF